MAWSSDSGGLSSRCRSNPTPRPSPRPTYYWQHKNRPTPRPSSAAPSAPAEPPRGGGREDGESKRGSGAFIFGVVALIVIALVVAWFCYRQCGDAGSDARGWTDRPRYRDSDHSPSSRVELAGYGMRQEFV